jgi:hypothetical protein
MNIVKTRLRNKIENKFLNDSLILYIKREIAQKFSTYSVINNFQSVKEHWVPF